jgi:hypothetical protein
VAGDWIKMRVGLAYDLKVMQIARYLNGNDAFLDQLAPDCRIETGQCNAQALQLLVIGALHKFWCAMQERSTDGKLTGLDTGDIDCLVGVWGFSEALMAVGWLEKDEDGSLQVHDWEAHNSESAKKRAVTLKRVTRHREVKRSGNGESVTKSLPEKRRVEEKSPPTPRKRGSVGDVPPEFESEFWPAYPRREAKAAAKRAYLRHVRDGELPHIVAWLDRAKQSEQWQDPNKIPHPATFLNDRRWDADPPPAPIRTGHTINPRTGKRSTHDYIPG